MFLIFILSLIITFLFSYILKKKKILLNFTGEKHQNFLAEMNIPLSGGIVIFALSFYFIDLSFIEIILISLIFFIGILSDLKLLKSPKLRIILQIVSVFFIINFLDIYLINTRIHILDFLLENKMFNLFFTCFCILIIINGSNFIDGVNNSTLGYYIVILIILFIFETNQFLIIPFVKISYLLAILTTLLFFNFLNKLYLGDSGSCQLGLLFSLLLIQLYIENQFISPFYIINLLWYPAFENLFSIFRKLTFSRSPIKADTNHLHQLIFLKFKQKKVSKNLIYLNNLTGILIVIYNLLILSFSSMFIQNTQIQIIIILFNIFLYIFIYRKLLNAKTSRGQI